MEVKLAPAVLPGVDDVLIMGSNYMRDRLGINVLATLKDKLFEGAATKVSPDEGSWGGRGIEGG